jgi:hypothetical protein
MTDASEHLPSIKRLTRDLVRSSSLLSHQEARFLVDSYYVSQENRKRSNNQVRAMEEGSEPHLLIGWLASQSETLEGQIKRALDVYAESHEAGRWMKSIYGIGPVIAAGMLAHIDIAEAPTVGHIWAYAGYDPDVKWEKGEKRPWNSSLKTLCWKTGQCFMKFSNAEECVYGAVYKERKADEIQYNDAGNNAELAAKILRERNYKKSTEAYKAYSKGKLPPGQIDARARRYAVKLFLSHLHFIWRFLHTKAVPPKPYAIGHMDHTHFIEPPNLDMIEGLTAAMKAAGLT